MKVKPRSRGALHAQKSVYSIAMKTMTYIATGVLTLVLLMTSVPTAEAASNSDQIRRLQAEISRLQAELNRLQNRTNNSWYESDSSVRLLGRGSAELSGTAAGRSGDRVRAWFEYGTTYSLPYSTPVSSATAGRTFYGIADGLSSGRTYYYRTVTETRGGDYIEGSIKSFRFSGSGYYDYDDDRDDDWDYDDRDDEDVPEVTTEDARDIRETRAEIRGEVDMQDAENGLVFFAYGQDEDFVDDVDSENRFRDIDEDGDDLQLIRVESNFDGDETFYAILSGLDDDTEYYFRMCVEFEDEDGDDAIICGDTESFETDRY